MVELIVSINLLTSVRQIDTYAEKSLLIFKSVSLYSLPLLMAPWIDISNIVWMSDNMFENLATM